MKHEGGRENGDRRWWLGAAIGDRVENEVLDLKKR